MPAGNDVLSNYRCLEEDEAGQSNPRDCYREAYGLTYGEGTSLREGLVS